jgi:molybdenum cofactor cytidylyltransferase
VVLADMPDVTAADLHLILALSAQAPGAILRAASEDGSRGTRCCSPPTFCRNSPR